MEKHLENIKHYRKVFKISQEHMAEKLGMDISSYNRIENGRVQMSVKKLYQISEIINIPVEYLVAEEKKEHIDERDCSECKTNRELIKILLSNINQLKEDADKRKVEKKNIEVKV